MKKLKHSLYAILAAMVWGAAFSAQSQCAKAGMAPFTVNVLRSVIAVVMLALIALINFRGFGNLKATLRQPGYGKSLLTVGFFCGLALSAASNLQQMALGSTESGRVGFITAMYLVLVPVLGLFFKKSAGGAHIWISVAGAVVGLYLLCVTPGTGFVISPTDGTAVLCAFLYAVHILLIDRFAQKLDGILLSLVQFLVMAVLSLVPALATESLTADVFTACLPSLLYVGILSSGVGYTLEIFALKGDNPAVISVLLSMESVFSVLSGALFLHERLSLREYVGCGVILLAVILSMLPKEKILSPYWLLPVAGVLLLLSFWHWLFFPAGLLTLAAFFLLKSKKNP